MIRKNKISILIITFTVLITKINLAQFSSYPLDIDYYNFINYKKNKIEIFGDSANYKHFFDKFNKLITRGEGKINIVHIGGSHIQADIYTWQMRRRLQTFYPGLNGGRGFVFPYKIAKTNNPFNYHADFTGNWNKCRNVEKKKCTLGLSGIVVYTNDNKANIKIYPRKKYGFYDFNKVKIFYNVDSCNYKISFPGKYKVLEKRINHEKKYMQILFADYYDTLDINIYKQDSLLNNKFALSAIYLENNDPGIVYNAIGINGASIPSFLKCQNLENDLSVIKPDMLILSLGTNDAYGNKFKPEIYKQNYQKLINIILKANPNTFILITVPNDDYLYKKYPNKNTALQETVIYELAHKNNCGVWNLYKIMGGFNSSQIWYNNNLMVRDKIHFTKKGYILKGNLFFNAFLKTYDNYINLIKNY